MKKNILISLTSLILMITTLNSNAQYTKLLDFDAITTGQSPNGSLISEGTFLYGMTQYGGANSMGTIFKIKPDGTGYYTLLDFAGVANGSGPQGSLISDGTFIYGMTYHGGTDNDGTIFKIKLDGTGYVKLLDFAGISNGQYPTGSLISDGLNLYGMTAGGGTYNYGTIFKILLDGTGYSKLFDFAGTINGQQPVGSLIFDGTFLYGTTARGGTGTCQYGCGTIFKIKPDGTGYSKLLDFSGTDGSLPMGSLMSDNNVLYGMTGTGGTNGAGTIFQIQPDGTGYLKLLDFDGAANGQSAYGDLISDGTFLYGMTYSGGIGINCGTGGCGVLFKIMPDGTGYSKLLDFVGSANGSYAGGSLISDGTFLYGMTNGGGTNNMGTVFKYNFLCTPVTYTQSPTICEGQSLIVGNNIYDTSGTYIDVLAASNGCDSTVTTILNVLPSITATLTPTVCQGQSVTIGGNTYSTSGTYTDVFTSSGNGCDSVVTTHLLVLSSSSDSSSQTLTICDGQSVTVGTDNYTSSGTYTYHFLGSTCDSAVTTHLTVLFSSNVNSSQTLVKCAGQSVSVGTDVYTTSGTYTYHFLSNGCDSAVTTHLIVLSSSNASSSQTLTIYSGLSITVGTDTYTTSGTYTYDFLGSGCDSTVITHLTVLPTPWTLQNSNITGSNKYIMSIAVNNINDVWAFTNTNEYAKTTDGGNTWLNSFVTGSAYYGCSNIAAINKDTAWVCMYKNAGVKGDVFRTCDGGLNWSIPDSTIYKSTTSFPNAVHFFDNSTGVCVGDPVNGSFEIYTTTNSGNNWNIVSSANIPSPIGGEYGKNGLYCAKDNNIWLGTDKGRILKSSDKGLTWSISTPFGLSVWIGAIAFKDDLNGIVMGSGTNNIKRTTDGGLTWNTFSIMGRWSYSYGQSLIYVKNSSTTPGFYLCGGINYSNKLASFSTDDGNTWTQLDTMRHASFGFYDANTGWTGAFLTAPHANIYKYNNTSSLGLPIAFKDNNFIDIYPNPFNLQTTITFNQEQKNITLKIFDVLGKELKTINFTGRQLLIEKGEMKAGVYFVQVIDSNKNVVNRKIVVQ